MSGFHPFEAEARDEPQPARMTAPTAEQVAERLTFEQYAARHGASRQDVGDAGNHRRGERHSDKTWTRALDIQRRKDAIWLARREGLRAAYSTAVALGEIEAPTHFARMIANANGHPDRESTQAARRVLAKRFGVDHTGAHLENPHAD